MDIFLSCIIITTSFKNSAIPVLYYVCTSLITSTVTTILNAYLHFCEFPLNIATGFLFCLLLRGALARPKGAQGTNAVPLEKKHQGGPGGAPVHTAF